MHTLLNQYWDYLRIERQVSPHTLTNYQHQLDAILAILAEKGIQHWQQVNPSVVRLILVESRKQGFKRKELGITFICSSSVFQLSCTTRANESESGNRYLRTETRQTFTKKY